MSARLAYLVSYRPVIDCLKTASGHEKWCTRLSSELHMYKYTYECAHLCTLDIHIYMHTRTQVLKVCPSYAYNPVFETDRIFVSRLRSNSSYFRDINVPNSEIVVQPKHLWCQSFLTRKTQTLRTTVSVHSLTRLTIKCTPWSPTGACISDLLSWGTTTATVRDVPC